MSHHPKAHLGDPTQHIEVNLPALNDVVGLRAGEVTLTIDPTLRRPIRVKPGGFAAYSDSAQRDVEEMLLTLNGFLAPFSIQFLKASVNADRSSWPTDAGHCATLLQLMHARAQQEAELTGCSIMVELSVSRSGGQNSKLRPSASCLLAGSNRTGRASTATLSGYRAAVESLWSGFIQNSLRDWLRENGVSEFRLRGEIPVNPSQAISATGRALPHPTASAA